MNGTFVQAFTSFFAGFVLLSACAAPAPTIRPTVVVTVVPQVVATEFTAELVGTLVIEDNCIRVKSTDFGESFLLVWPPDLSARIEANLVHITIGLVTGKRQEVVLRNGQKVHISGGEVNPPNDQLKKTEPTNCPGPYFAVGSEVTPL